LHYADPIPAQGITFKERDVRRVITHTPCVFIRDALPASKFRKHFHFVFIERHLKEVKLCRWDGITVAQTTTCHNRKTPPEALLSLFVFSEN
jgi:hypothetical protein